MNNPDLTQAQELAQAFKDAGIEPPESEKYWIPQTNFSTKYIPIKYSNQGTIRTDAVPAYSTDELLAILPYAIITEETRYMLALLKRKRGYYLAEYLGLESKFAHGAETALTELLKWALKEHPEAVRKHLEEI